jgi:HlyD family secretion protein
VIRATILLLGLGLVSSTLAGPATTQSTQPAKEISVVKRGVIHPRIDADGFFEPVDALEVRFRPESYAGDLKIVSVVPHGSSVYKGDVLIEVDASDVKRQIASAEAELENSTAAVAKAKADSELGEQADEIALKIQESELVNAKSALKWFEDVDGKQMLDSAGLQTKTAKAAVEDQQDELDQLKKMYKSEELTNATADIVVKRALRNLEINKVSAGMAKDREEKSKQFDYEREHGRLAFAIEQQTNQVAQIRASQAQSKITRKTALETAIASQDREQKKLDDLNKDLAGMTIKAPFDGVVYYGQLTGGAWVSSGPKALRIDDKVTANQVAMTLFAPGRMRVVADIPESRLLWIKPGDKARIVPMSNPGASLTGTCDAMIAVATNQLYSLPVELEKTDPRLSPGQRASVQIDLPNRCDVLTAPCSAIVHGRAKIMTSEGCEESRNVVTGVCDEKNIEIVSGLKEGETLILDK